MDERLFDLPPLPPTDWSEHNEEQREVWKRFDEGTPTRVPMILGVNPRFLLCDRKYNTRGVSFRDYMTDPDIMRRAQCEFFLFRRHFLLYDQEMGLPDQWNIYVDFQNVGEAAWLGAELLYPEGDAVIENFFGLLKSELLYLQEFGSMEYFKVELAHYLDYYNNRRAKAKRKGLPPALHRRQALAAV